MIWGFTNLQCISIVERVGFCGFAMPADFENQRWDWIQNFINTLTYVCCNNINQEIMQNQVNHQNKSDFKTTNSYSLHNRNTL